MDDWAIVVTGVLSAGLGSGVASALVSPHAVARAEEVRLRNEARRRLVSDGRALVVEANREGWPYQEVGLDPRFAALRRHLPADVTERYDAPPRTVIVPPDNALPHNKLVQAIDDLEERWRLV